MLLAFLIDCWEVPAVVLGTLICVGLILRIKPERSKSTGWIRGSMSD